MNVLNIFRMILIIELMLKKKKVSVLFPPHLLLLLRQTSFAKFYVNHKILARIQALFYGQ
jgi:hypothetical protein